MNRWSHAARRMMGALMSACLLGGSLRAHPVAQRADESSLPNAYYDQLLNGLQVIVLERPGASEAILSLMIKSGAAFDRAGKSGTAALTARALWLGAEDLSGTTLRERLAALEARVQTEVTWDSTTITVEAPARGLPELIRLVARVVSRPTFDAEAVAALKEQFLEEVKAKSSDPAALADALWYRALYHPHPYARPSEGLPEEIATITPLDLARHHARFFIANNATLIIFSPFSPSAVMPLIRPYFGALLKGKIAPSTFVVPTPAQGVRIMIRDFPEAPLVHLRLGSFGLERFSEDYFPALILAEALCFRYAREFPGTLSSVSCRFELRTHRGPFLLSLAVPRESVVLAIERALHILTEMRSHGPTDEELAEAGRRWRERSVQTPREIVHALHLIELHGLGRDYVQKLPERLQQVTREDVKRVAERYLSPQDLLIVLVGRDHEFAEALKAFGSVNVLPER